MTKPEVFNPNSRGPDEISKSEAPSNFGAILPMVPQATSAEGYAAAFRDLAGAHGNPATSLTAFAQEMMKAQPPSIESWTALSSMPLSGNTGGVLQWPGFPPLMLKRMAREHLAPQAIIQQRIADIGRYSDLSSHPWKPGWRVQMRAGHAKPEESDLQEIKEAERFLLNCNSRTGWDARSRDKSKLTNFRTFLETYARDSLTYAMSPIWTDMDLKGNVRAFKALPAYNVRLCAESGYNGDKNLFAVAVDDSGRVEHAFTREQLTVPVRNPRNEADITGYGYPEMEMCVRIIQAISNAFEMNANTFNKNSVPQGLLLLEGGMLWGQKQVDALNRLWTDLNRGITKKTSLPALAVPKDGGISMLDLTGLNGADVRYESFINMLFGLYCVIYQFPVHRLGYFTSGKGGDNKQQTGEMGPTSADKSDPGLEPFLNGIANIVTEYLIRPNWPNLEFRFLGANPDEDMRLYEARMLSGTLDEKRALSDMPPMETLAKGKSKEEKQILKLMGMAPVDPNLAGVFQSLVQVVIGGAQESEAEAGESRMTSKIDPAQSAKHGHAAGVRRDSKAETKKGRTPQTLYAQRSVVNAEEIIAWAKAEGFETCVPPEELHVTIAHSSAPFCWYDSDAKTDTVTIRGGTRSVEPLGGKGAIVLKFDSGRLQDDWLDLRDAGASWDYDSYMPHITLTYSGNGPDLAKVSPFSGKIVLGPEKFQPMTDSWLDGVIEKADEDAR